LEAALARSREGVGSVVLVAGEAGMGKSRLISEIAGHAERHGMTVAVGECLPFGEGELPYAPVVGALRSLASRVDDPELQAMLAPGREELAGLMHHDSHTRDRVVDPAAGTGSQLRLFEHLSALLVSAARVRALVLVVEDFHWADRSTRDFLSFLVRAARREPIALVISYRSDELRRHHPFRPFVLELERSDRATKVELGPFSSAELREQVAAILDQTPPPSLVDRLLERSEGNPFFAEELLASSSGPNGPLPSSLRDILLARVEAQSDAVRDVLRIAAAAGRTVDHALLVVAADLSEADLHVALRDAVEAYLLVSESSVAGYSFRHALVREAIYSDLLAGERRSLHLSLARAISDQSGSAAAQSAVAGELAHHWYAAGELVAALPASVAAGVAAEDLCASSEAWRHYERALEIWDAVDPAPGELPFERLEVLRRAAEAAVRSGEEDRAIALAREVIARIDELAEPVQAALAHERLGRYLWTAGHDQDALPAYRRAVELMPEAPPSEERALVLAAEGQVLMLCNRPEESSARCAEALVIARTVGAEAVQAHVLNTICGNLSTVGDLDRAVTAARQALAIARRLRLVEEMQRSYTNGSDALDEAGHVEESIAMAREGIESAREVGAERQWGDFLRGEVAGRLMQIGRWIEAEKLLDDLVDQSPTGVSAGIAYRYLGLLRAEQGEFDAATRALDQAEPQMRRSIGSMALAPQTAARITLELWAGRPTAAAALTSDCLDRVRDRESLFFTARVYDLGARACADLAAGALANEQARKPQAARAAQLLERLDRLIGELTGVVPPVVRASRAGCAAEQSRIGHVGDASLWADAARQWEHCGNPYDAAYAKWRGAEALLGSGIDRAGATALVQAAHEVADELGARPLREQLEALARRARIDLGTRERSDAAPHGQLQELELTPREIEVLALLSDGLTNREIGAELFISDKTASVHVSRILTKLAVPNRAAAAATAQRLGVTRDQTPSAN
jgi:DNA-binding CsgD family transcriptional regulator